MSPVRQVYNYLPIILNRKSEEQIGLRFILLTSSETSLKLHIRVSNFQKFPVGACPQTPPRMLMLRSSQSVLRTLCSNSSHWQHHVYSSNFNIYNGLTNPIFPPPTLVDTQRSYGAWIVVSGISYYVVSENILYVS